ncbi:MAG TPA: carboxypeptidase-like regulatory domain-containing protein [Thermoanaerobaculia bacterium]|nr:carboxypeptidase-like regulatory domain-containing protein [Thermoanaerobaculia bacterium]
MRHLPARAFSFRLGPALLGLALLLTALPLAAARYDQGEKVQVTGIVSDRQGQPLANLNVTLEVSRSSFSVRELRRTDKDTRRVSTTTNARGEYTLVWPWDSYFNKFELVVGVPVRKTQGERLEVLVREEVTRRVLAGSPAVAALVVENTKFLNNLRQFVASVQSDDERKVYDEMGKPDEVKRVQYPDHVEASWWYFETGKVYRFRDGRLEQVVPFDPVKGSSR